MFTEISGHIRFGEVFDDGGRPTLLNQNDFARLGFKGRVVFRGEPTTALKRFSASASYIFLYGVSGPLDQFRRFDTGIGYALDAKSHFGVAINYINGNLDTTLEEVEYIKGELTAKF